MCLFKQIFRNKAFMHSILLMKYPCLKTAHHYISDKLLDLCSLVLLSGSPLRILEKFLSILSKSILFILTSALHYNQTAVAHFFEDHIRSCTLDAEQLLHGLLGDCAVSFYILKDRSLLIVQCFLFGFICRKIV